MKLYDYLPSGNGYKIRLLLAWLGRSYDYQEMNIHKGDTKTPEFLALNPVGQIPVLALDDGQVLAESNSILYYLANHTPYFPSDLMGQTQVLRWMFFEQYKHEPNIAVARFIKIYAPERAEELPCLYKKGYQALSIMDTHLSENQYFVGQTPSIADISLYAYTHVADEGGYSLEPYPHVQNWLSRLAVRADMVEITDKPIGAS